MLFPTHVEHLPTVVEIAFFCRFGLATRVSNVSRDAGLSEVLAASARDGEHADQQWQSAFGGLVFCQPRIKNRLGWWRALTIRSNSEVTSQGQFDAWHLNRVG
jgi:hypothetical protein